MEKRNKGKFIVILLIFAVITAFSVVYYQQGAAADAKQRTDKELSDIANEQAKTLQVRLQGQYILLETFATVLTGEGEMDPVRVQNGMDAIVENSLFLHIAVLDGTGNGRLNTGEEIFVGDRSYFQEAMAGKNIIERIEQDKLNNKVRFIQAVPLMQGGVPVGVVFGSYEEEVIKELLDSEAFSDQAATYLCDSQGEIVVGSDSDVYLYREGMPLAGETNVLRGYGRERSKEEVEGFAKNLREGDAGIFTVSVEDYDRNVVYAPTGINDWFIINGVPSEFVRQSTNEMSQIALRLLLLLMCTAVIATGTVIFQERRNQKRLGREQEKLRISEEEYRIAARQSNKHIARYDIRTKTLYQHKETAALLGTESICRDVPESRIAEGFVAPESIAAYREFYAQMIRGEASGSKDVRMKNAINGEFRWYHGDFTLVYDQDNQPIHGVISFYDVTKQREKEIAYTLWKQSISSLPREKTAIFEYNLSENLQESASGCLNGAELKQINMSFKERVLYWGQNVVCHEYVDLYSSFLNLERLLSDFHRGIREDSLEFKAFPEGAAECRWIKGSIKMAEYPDTGQVKGVLIYEDIHEEKMNHLAIKEEAETDFLTGVFNRKTFMEKMQPLLKGGQGQQHLLMMMDLDHFKQINDSLGHREGDRVLKTLAKGLKREIEETGEGFVGRIGGDEFMICMEAVEEKSVVEKAEALRMLLRIQVTENVYTSGSIGVASYPQDGTDFDTLYANADTALYRAKEKGRNCVAFYSLGEEDGNED